MKDFDIYYLHVIMACPEGVLEVEQISSIYGTTLAEKVETFVCFLENFFYESACLLSCSRMEEMKEVKTVCSGVFERANEHICDGV